MERFDLGISQRVEKRHSIKAEDIVLIERLKYAFVIGLEVLRSPWTLGDMGNGNSVIKKMDT